jgi:predicted membrane-bound mannosyltransferase
VQVYYTTPPTVLNNTNDDFESVTGLPESCQDVIVLGAAYRMVSFVDPGRLTFGSAEADQMSQIAGRAYSAGTNASKYLLALYEKRLDEEGKKLDENNPVRIHYSK